MGLGFTPIVRVRGAHAAMINQRLISWELVDDSGYQSDQLTLRVDTQGVSGLPREGDSVGLEVGYAEDSSLTDKGDYKITRIMPRLFPDSVTIVATAAPFQVDDQTEYKKRRSRSFENISLGELFRNIVRSHGFEPRVAGDLDAIQLDHVDQSDETDMSFISRLAKRYDAIAKPVNNLYVLARRGQIKTISGQSMQPVPVSLPADNKPTNQSFINASADLASRGNFNGAIATYWDANTGKEEEVSRGEAPFKKIRDQQDSLLQAEEVASGELRKLKRSGIKIKLDMPGNPALGAEGLVSIGSGFPDYMQGSWSIDRVISRGSRGEGYRCSVEASEPV